MQRNIGPVERTIRGIAGLVILGLYGALPAPWQLVALLGLYPLGTAIVGHCPVNRLRERHI